MKKMAAEPVTKKSKKGVGSYDSHYKEEWAELILLALWMEIQVRFIAFLVKRVLAVRIKAWAMSSNIAQGKLIWKIQSRKMSLKPANTNDEKQIRAEVLHTNFIVQHNISFLTTDHMAPLYRAMFPDSNIAKNFRCICNFLHLKWSIISKNKNEFGWVHVRKPLCISKWWVKRLWPIKNEPSLCLHFWRAKK